jgi:hypothetical protein
MKKKLLPIFLLALLTGCSLLPGRVEYFQKEVQPIPELSASQVQHQKQAAEYVAEKAQETKENAIETGADVSVIVPATETAVVAGSLSTSMGPPLRPHKGTAEALAATVERDRAKVDQKIDKQRHDTAALVGKDIEGTGAISMSWFTQAGIVLGACFLVFTALKIYGLFNPIVGAGMGITQRVTGKMAAAAFSSTAHGIEEFKGLLEDGVTYTKDQIKEALATSLQMKQDGSVQDLAYRLTRR